jgi:hypothetical protein
MNIAIGSGEEVNRALYEHPGLKAGLLAVMMNDDGREHGKERRNTTWILSNLTSSGTKLAQKLYEYPDLMAGLEKVKRLSGDTNAEARTEASNTIEEITKHKQPDWFSRLRSDKEMLQHIEKELFAVRKELGESCKEQVEMLKKLDESRDSLFRIEKVISSTRNSLASPEVLDLDDINATMVSPPPAIDSNGNKRSNLTILAENNDNVKRVKKEYDDTARQLENVQDEVKCTISLGRL